MRSTWLLFACASIAVMTSPALAQDNGPGYFALGLTGGVTAIKLPGLSEAFTEGDVTTEGAPDNLALGYTLGISGAIGIGEVGGHDAFIGINAFGTSASVSNTTTQTFSGRGMVVVSGLTTPTDSTINLVTTRGPGINSTAGYLVANPDNGEGGAAVVGPTLVNSPPPGPNGASTSQVASSNTINSFAFGAGNTTYSAGAQSALAAGAIANVNGGIFIAVGDLDGLEIDHQTSVDVQYAGADITFGVNKPVSDTSTFQAYGGPSFRYLGQQGSNSVTIDLPEVAGTTVVHPLYTMDRDVDIASYYLGGVVGGVYSFAVSDAGTISVGLEGSLYHVSTDVDGQDAYTIAGGSGVVGWGAGTQTVTGPAVSENTTGIAVAARAQLGYSHKLNDSLTLSLTGSADYLSAAASPKADVTYATPATADAATWSSGSGDDSIVSFGSMWAFNLSASLTGQF